MIFQRISIEKFERSNVCLQNIILLSRVFKPDSNQIFNIFSEMSSIQFSRIPSFSGHATIFRWPVSFVVCHDPCSPEHSRTCFELWPLLTHYIALGFRLNIHVLQYIPGIFIRLDKIYDSEYLWICIWTPKYCLCILCCLFVSVVPYTNFLAF